MASIYAISDPHGCLDVLERALSVVDLDEPENRLVLLGDYIPHQTYDMGEREFLERCEESLAFVKSYCDAHAGRVIVLKGNHEFSLQEDIREGLRSIDAGLAKWMRDLPLLHETDEQIFVHAGIDEEAGEFWKVGAIEEVFLAKHPATFGPFAKDIVAGHNGTFGLSGRIEGFNGALWDGESHYFIDGSTETSGKIPVLRYDTETARYRSFLATADGVEDDDGPLKMSNPTTFTGEEQSDDWW